MLVGAWNQGEDLEAFIECFRNIEYPDKELNLAVGGAHRLEDMKPLLGDGVLVVPNPGGGRTLLCCVVWRTRRLTS